MRPGKPTALAVVNGKPLILLPGYPVAAIISFNVFARPVIAKMLGAPLAKMFRQTIRARLLRRLPSRSGTRDYARVLVKRTKAGYVAEPIRITGAGVISSIVTANGLVVVPEDTEGFEKDEEVEVTLLRPLED
jgi:molybdopterin biosynthesis enzyme